METGVQIRILREYKHFSRETMAELLGVSTNTYQKIESGEKIPNLKELQLISEKLEIDPAHFLKKNGVFINNVSNSPGVGTGNTVSMNKDLLIALTDTLNKLNQFLDQK